MLSMKRATWSLALMLTLILRVSAAPAPDLFEKASDLYIDGLYDESAAAFRSVLGDTLGAGALHNLGNAEWHRGNVGQAVLAWERARWLDPFNADSSVNLRFARRSTELPDPQLTWHEKCSSWLPVSTWAWLACIGFWLAADSLALPHLLRWNRVGWVQSAAAIGLGLFLLSAPGILGVESRRRLAVLLQEDVPLRLTPTVSAQVLTTLPAGDVVRIKRERGQYLYIRTPDGGGWILRSEAGLIARADY